jgi:hypothetical protein
MAGPQTTREALMAELLGDCGTILDRIEALQAAIPAVADAAATQVFIAGEDAAKNIKSAADSFAALLDGHRDQIVKPLREATVSMVKSADAVDGGARQLANKAMLCGMAGGVIGGLVAGIAVAAFFMS